MSLPKQIRRLCGGLGFGLVIAVIAAGCAPAQSASADYDVSYIGPRMADPVLQHSKETYVLFGCAYCHGLYLKPRGEAADLMHSRLVGKDENANLIGPLLRAGIPQTAKLSPMPQFSDLSDQQIADIARWIHYARQRGRYKELIDANASGVGDATRGKEYFENTCSSCHTIRDLAKTAGKLNGAALKAEILDPKALQGPPSWRMDQLRDAKTAEARQRHRTLLENYSAEDVANVSAYLQSAR
jgi:mono/diheme cytochrome c family protein